jgi:thioredoxin reductase
MASSKQNIKIAIIGGGLGGLPAAIALGNLGYDGKSLLFYSKVFVLIQFLAVHLFEQAPGYCCTSTPMSL